MLSDPRFWSIAVVIALILIAQLVIERLCRWSKAARTSIDQTLTIEAFRRDKLVILSSLTDQGSLIWAVYLLDSNKEPSTIPCSEGEEMDLKKAKRFADKHFPFPYKPRQTTVL